MTFLKSPDTAWSCAPPSGTGQKGRGAPSGAQGGSRVVVGMGLHRTPPGPSLPSGRGRKGAAAPAPAARVREGGPPPLHVAHTRPTPNRAGSSHTQSRTLPAQKKRSRSTELTREGFEGSLLESRVLLCLENAHKAAGASTGEELEVICNLFLVHFQQDFICEKNRTKRAFPLCCTKTQPLPCGEKRASDTHKCGLDLGSILKTGKVVRADL